MAKNPSDSSSGYKISEDPVTSSSLRRRDVGELTGLPPHYGKDAESLSREEWRRTCANARAIPGTSKPVRAFARRSRNIACARFLAWRFAKDRRCPRIVSEIRKAPRAWRKTLRQR